MKNCDRCRALHFEGGKYPRCELGYKIDQSKIAPLEDCPKPRTYLGLIEAREEQRATRLNAQTK